MKLWGSRGVSMCIGIRQVVVSHWADLRSIVDVCSMRQGCKGARGGGRNAQGNLGGDLTVGADKSCQE